MMMFILGWFTALLIVWAFAAGAKKLDTAPQSE